MCLPVPRKIRQHSLELLTCGSLGLASPMQPQYWVVTACRLSHCTMSSQAKATSKMNAVTVLQGKWACVWMVTVEQLASVSWLTHFPEGPCSVTQSAAAHAILGATLLSVGVGEEMWVWQIGSSFRELGLWSRRICAPKSPVPVYKEQCLSLQDGMC